MIRLPGTSFLKDPQSIEPEGFDWTTWLAEFATTELIVTSTWALTGDDVLLTLSNAAIVTGSLKTQVTMTGGTAGVTYKLTNTVNTTSGYKDERSFFVVVKDK